MSAIRAPRRIRRFKTDEDASVTVEFVLWLPFLCSFFLLATDATVAFMRQSQMWQVSRDTARIVSRYGMDSDTAKNYAELKAGFGTSAPVANVDTVTDPTEVVVTMTLPASEMTVFGTLNFALGENITTRVVHAMEPGA